MGKHNKEGAETYSPSAVGKWQTPLGVVPSQPQHYPVLGTVWLVSQTHPLPGPAAPSLSRVQPPSLSTPEREI